MPGFNVGGPDVVRSHRWILKIPGVDDRYTIYAKKIELPVFDGEVGAWTEFLIQLYQEKETLAFFVNNVADLLYKREVEIKIVLGQMGDEGQDWDEAAWKITGTLREFSLDDLDYEDDGISTMLLRFSTKCAVLGRVGRATGVGGFEWHWDEEPA